MVLIFKGTAFVTLFSVVLRRRNRHRDLDLSLDFCSEMPETDTDSQKAAFPLSTAVKSGIILTYVQEFLFCLLEFCVGLYE